MAQGSSKAILAVVIVAIIVIGGVLIFSGPGGPAETSPETQGPPDEALENGNDEVMNNEEEEEQPSGVATGTEENATPTPAAGDNTGTTDMKEVTVSGTEFEFSPETIRVSPGQTVRVTFENTGGTVHDFVVEGLNARTSVISPGETDTAEFTAPEEPGEYPVTFFCSVGSHREAGMEGTLIVEE